MSTIIEVLMIGILYCYFFEMTDLNTDNIKKT